MSTPNSSNTSLSSLHSNTFPKTSTNKPTLLLLPGAWHLPTAFTPTTSLLTPHFKIHPHPLPSVGASPPHKSFAPDVQSIRSTLEILLSSGEDVILILHSYSGICGSEALSSYLEMLQKTDGKGNPGWGKVLRLIYICAFVLPAGKSLMNAIGDEYAPWMKISGDQVAPLTPHQTFYNDLTPSQSAPYIESLLPQSIAVFSSPVTVEPWRVIPSTYIICENDQAIPLAGQEFMVATAKNIAPGSFDNVERCDASHSPFISQPEWLAEKIIMVCGGL